MSKLSVVVSVYNEEAVIDQFHRTIVPILKNMKCDYEIIYVNDGSVDQSEQLLDAIGYQCEQARIIHFSRNFGHEAAMLCGIDYSTGDYVVCMDSDLQHPPEKLPEMLEAFENGGDILLMARQTNKDAGLFKNFTSNMFYYAMNWLGNEKIEQNVSDFFGISKKVAKLFQTEYREKRRFLRGYIQHVGFHKVVIEYEAQKRFAGSSKYTFKKLLNMCAIAVVNFSKNLVRAGFWFALLACLIGIAFAVYTISSRINEGNWNTVGILSSVISFFFMLQFILMGIMGEYIGAILSETNRRPIYIVRDIVETTPKENSK